MTPRPDVVMVARTRALLPREVDRLDPVAWAGEEGFLYRSPGLALAGRGVAARLSLSDGLGRISHPDAVAGYLGAIDADDEVGMPGSGPVAVGSLPFDPGAPGSLVVPSMVVVKREDGFGWITTVAPRQGGRPDTGILDPAPLPGSMPPDAFRLAPMPAHTDWLHKVEEAVAAVNAGHLEKVVLSRRVVVDANRPLVVSDVLRRLAVLYPSCTVFSVDGFVGASPELLVRRTGREVVSFPLAGTVAHSGDPTADARAAAALLASMKERHEHEVAAREVVRALGDLCDDLSVPSSPSIVSLRNVSHLGTEIRGKLHESAQLPSVLELAASLHPTPAVAGTPREQALAWIGKLEGAPRGPYAGPVGWMDARGDGEFMVGIRSAFIEENTAYLFAGVGIVGDSEPERELAETQLKLQALLAAVVRP